jgi:hypothetical protein
MAAKRGLTQEGNCINVGVGSHVLFVHDGSHNPQVIKTKLYLGKKLILDAL